MLRPGTVTCPVCGVQQREAAAPVDMQGGYPGYARTGVAMNPVVVPQNVVPGVAPLAGAAHAPQAPYQPGASNMQVPSAHQSQNTPGGGGRSAQRIVSMYALGDAFVGTPAGVGARILSLLIDLFAIAGVGVGAWLLSSSWLLGVIAGLEVAIIFMVAQARTGASLGKLVTHTRVSRADAPQSPGLVRSGVRAAVTGAGALLAAVGAVAVELSALADSSGKRRTIADRAARTVVVTIPTEQARIEAEEVAQESAHSEYLATLSGDGMDLGTMAADSAPAAGSGSAAGMRVIAQSAGGVAPEPDAGARGMGVRSSDESAVTSERAAAPEPVVAPEPAGSVPSLRRSAPAAVPAEVPPVPSHMSPVQSGGVSAPIAGVNPSAQTGGVVPPAHPGVVPPAQPSTVVPSAQSVADAPGISADGVSDDAPAPGPRRTRSGVRDSAVGQSPHAQPAQAAASSTPKPSNSDEPAPGPRRRSGAASEEPSGIVRRGAAGTVLTFDTGQREIVAAYSTVALGRAPSATGGEDQLIVVTDSSTTISKNHARWEEDRSGVWVTDLGSTNGTELIFADGRTAVLTPGVRTSAQGVARIRLGDRTFTMSPLNGDSA
ncbi:RDD family protein [Microbacterium sp. NC79]|uniref:RDD family protein n=1 Tax=Microbacterium sp. NC79 TaxID=2851009 RepID=UPI001C2BE46E|nr:RDD family protein [Microbacterium sp. NC79]MBV0894038.1 RDD family protein [Microbacterium sp. NC79]